MHCQRIESTNVERESNSNERRLYANIMQQPFSVVIDFSTFDKTIEIDEIKTGRFLACRCDCADAVYSSVHLPACKLDKSARLALHNGVNEKSWDNERKHWLMTYDIGKPDILYFCFLYACMLGETGLRTWDRDEAEKRKRLYHYWNVRRKRKTKRDIARRIGKT